MMRTMTLLAAMIVLLPHLAAAHVVRHSSIPQPFWGTWGSGAAQCVPADKQTIVLAAKTYVSDAAQCDVEYVSETPSPKGSTYSASLQCTDSSAASPKKAGMTLIFRSAGDGRISVGRDFDSLVDYRRCAANKPAQK